MHNCRKRMRLRYTWETASSCTVFRFNVFCDRNYLAFRSVLSCARSGVSGHGQWSAIQVWVMRENNQNWHVFEVRHRWVIRGLLHSETLDASGYLATQKPHWPINGFAQRINTIKWNARVVLKTLNYLASCYKCSCVGNWMMVNICYVIFHWWVKQLTDKWKTMPESVVLLLRICVSVSCHSAYKEGFSSLDACTTLNFGLWSRRTQVSARMQG